MLQNFDPAYSGAIPPRPPPQVVERWVQDPAVLVQGPAVLVPQDPILVTPPPELQTPAPRLVTQIIEPQLYQPPPQTVTREIDPPPYVVEEIVETVTDPPPVETFEIRQDPSYYVSGIDGTPLRQGGCYSCNDGVADEYGGKTSNSGPGMSWSGSRGSTVSRPGTSVGFNGSRPGPGTGGPSFGNRPGGPGVGSRPGPGFGNRPPGRPGTGPGTGTGLGFGNRPSGRPGNNNNKPNRPWPGQGTAPWKGNGKWGWGSNFRWNNRWGPERGFGRWRQGPYYVPGYGFGWRNRLGLYVPLAYSSFLGWGWQPEAICQYYQSLNSESLSQGYGPIAMPPECSYGYSGVGFGVGFGGSASVYYWSPNQSYSFGDVVQYDNQLWKARDNVIYVDTDMAPPAEVPETWEFVQALTPPQGGDRGWNGNRGWNNGNRGYGWNGYGNRGYGWNGYGNRGYNGWNNGDSVALGLGLGALAVGTAAIAANAGSGRPHGGSEQLERDIMRDIHASGRNLSTTTTTNNQNQNHERKSGGDKETKRAVFEWSPYSNYPQGSKVHWNGNLFQARTSVITEMDAQPSPSSNYWKSMGDVRRGGKYTAVKSAKSVKMPAKTGAKTRTKTSTKRSTSVSKKATGGMSFVDSVQRYDAETYKPSFTRKQWKANPVRVLQTVIVKIYRKYRDGKRNPSVAFKIPQTLTERQNDRPISFYDAIYKTLRKVLPEGSFVLRKNGTVILRSRAIKTIKQLINKYNSSANIDDDE